MGGERKVKNVQQGVGDGVTGVGVGVGEVEESQTFLSGDESRIKLISKSQTCSAFSLDKTTFRTKWCIFQIQEGNFFIYFFFFPPSKAQ